MEACDDMASMLAETKSRVERAKSFGAETTIVQRITALAGIVSKAVTSFTKFVLSVPGRMVKFAALSRDERRQVYKGWWGAVKKEAYHYWVRCPALPYLRRLHIAHSCQNKSLACS